jgi:signal transduction histidine kinase
LALLEDCREKLAPEERDYLHRVRAAAGRMGRLVDDRLALARTSRQQLVRQNLDLRAMAQGILLQLQVCDPDRKVRAVVAPAPLLSVELLCAEPEMRRKGCRALNKRFSKRRDL